MARNYTPGENAKRAQGRRQFALDRVEFRRPSEPRMPAAGPISAPLKARVDADDGLIRDFLKRREADR